jgi:hypothetical protein
VSWLNNRWHELTGASSATWLAIAAWAAVALGVLVLFYAHRQIQRGRRLTAAQTRPHVVMFMEPHPADWYLIELVVRNFGATAAHDIRFAFFNPPTVPAYEEGYQDGPVDVVPLQLPSGLPVLAPGQEWRTVWDSSRDRAELGDAIESRFVGTVTYYDRPAEDGEGRRFGFWHKRRRMQSKVILDWKTLQPVPRLELLTEHDLAKREKQKLELLRSMLTYFSYASRETRPEVLRTEIEKMNRAAEESHDRWRTRLIDDAPQLDKTTELDLPWVEDEAGRHHR